MPSAGARRAASAACCTRPATPRCASRSPSRAAHGVPWGISESAYAGSDHTLAYQYAPQGVPRLALRRTPRRRTGGRALCHGAGGADRAAPRRRRTSRALEALGARARYGFIEALDFTPARQTGTRAASRRCDTFMAHHQGMSIVALANVLLDGVAQRWGMADAAHRGGGLAAARARAARGVGAVRAAAGAAAAGAAAARAGAAARGAAGRRRAGADASAVERPLQRVAARQRRRLEPLGRDRHHALARRCAARRARQLLLPALGPASRSRSRSPSTRRPTRGAHYQSIFHADRVCFDAAWPELQAHTTVWVSPEDDIEFRQVELRNLSDRTLEHRADVGLRGDAGRPARRRSASGVHQPVRARRMAGRRTQALCFERKPRLPDRSRRCTRRISWPTASRRC